MPTWCAACLRRCLPVLDTFEEDMAFSEKSMSPALVKGPAFEFCAYTVLPCPLPMTQAAFVIISFTPVAIYSIWCAYIAV